MRKRRPLSFGVRLPVSGPLASPQNALIVAELAEGLGYDSIWVHDHIQWTKEMHEHHISSGSAEALREGQEPHFLEAITLLAFLAAKTKRVWLGLACLVLPCRNPIYAAKQAANIDRLSEGRLILGIGIGSRTTIMAGEFRLFQVPLKGRGERLEDYARAMKVLWERGVASYRGPYVTFEGAEIYPKPTRGSIPLWVGGWSDEAARRAARVGDGWIPGWLSPQEMRRGVEVLSSELDRVGRKGAQITIAVEKYLRLGRSDEMAKEKARATITTSLYTYERRMGGYEEAQARHIIGSPSTVASTVGEFIDAGVEHFEFKVIYSSLEDLREQLLLFRDEVMKPLKR